MRICSVSTLLAIFCTVVIAATGCSAYHQTRGQARKSGEITVSTDPRIELLSVVQYLSDYRAPDGKPMLTRLDFPYKQRTVEYFTPFREHPAVRCFGEMCKTGFTFGMPPETMLSLTNPPELKVVRPFSDLVVSRAGGKEKLDAFIAELRRFSKDTHFMDFYRLEHGFYEEITRDYTAHLHKWASSRDIEEYFGWRQAGYHIILAPFFHPGGFGPCIPRANGVYDVYDLCGPYSIKDGRIEFGSETEIRYIIWHEFSHSFVNSLTDSSIGKLIEPCTTLMPPISDEKLKQAGVDRTVIVSEWVSEHIIRATTTRLTYLKQGDEAGDIFLKRETKYGYPYVEALCQNLMIYEQNRDTWPTLREYYPELIRVFEDAAAKKKTAQ